MIEIIINHNRNLNPSRLAEQFRDVVGANYRGLSTAPNVVRVQLATKPDAADITALESVVQNHNATEQSAVQQLRKQHQARLQQLRDSDVALNEAMFNALSLPVQQLAKKVLLLEAELKRLRGA